MSFARFYLCTSIKFYIKTLKITFSTSDTRNKNNILQKFLCMAVWYCYYHFIEFNCRSRLQHFGTVSSPASDIYIHALKADMKIDCSTFSNSTASAWDCFCCSTCSHWFQACSSQCVVLAHRHMLLSLTMPTRFK